MQTQQAEYYNRKPRQLEITEKVLLLPEAHNKLHIRWEGPLTMTEKLNRMNYKIKMGKKENLPHKLTEEICRTQKWSDTDRLDHCNCNH